MYRIAAKQYLNKINIWQGLDGFWLGGEGVEISLLWLDVVSLQVSTGSSASTNGLLDSLVFFSSGNNLSLALGWQSMGGGNVKHLLDNSAVDLSNNNLKKKSLLNNEIQQLNFMGKKAC